MTVLGKFRCDFEHSEEDLKTIASLFEAVGGSWTRMAEGGSSEWDTLRKACKVYVKNRKGGS